MAKRLIINADDFGVSPGVNRAIAELARAGVISSATLMAGGHSFDDAVAIARAQPSLGVGCHLVFVDGTPLSAAESVASLLGGDGHGFRTSLLEFAQAVILGRVREEEIELETVAQIASLQAAGLAVTHVDTHKHTHMFPAVARAVLRGALRCGIRRYRFPFEPRWSRDASKGDSPLGRRLQMVAVQRLEHGFVKATRGAGVTTGGTLGMVATGVMTRDLLLKAYTGVETTEEGKVLELCVHPGHVDDVLKKTGTRLVESREIEYGALMELGAFRMTKPGDIEVVHYGQLEADEGRV